MAMLKQNENGLVVGDTKTIGLMRPFAVSRRDSYYAQPNSFYLLFQWEMGGITETEISSFMGVITKVAIRI